MCLLGLEARSDDPYTLHDATVSQHHCRFEPGGGRLWVRDLGSTNGTHVQGVRMQRAELTTGMRVRIGRTDLHVLAVSSDEGAPPARRVPLPISRRNRDGCRSRTPRDHVSASVRPARVIPT